MLLTATPSFALFGIGDIVFDPTSYASLVQQLTTLQMQYNTVKNNLTHFSFKQQWQMTLHALENVNVANVFGETAGMSIALNTNSPSASSTAWKATTITMNGSAPTYLASQSLGSARTSQLASIETSDAVSPDCLTAVGQYRGDRNTNRSANSSLVSSQFDASDSTNSEVQQLNLLNAAEGRRWPRCSRKAPYRLALLHRRHLPIWSAATQNGGALTQLGLTGTGLHFSVHVDQHGRQLGHANYDASLSCAARSRW